jgi:hypothetical protein
MICPSGQGEYFWKKDGPTRAKRRSDCPTGKSYQRSWASWSQDCFPSVIEPVVWHGPTACCTTEQPPAHSALQENIGTLKRPSHAFTSL